MTLQFLDPRLSAPWVSATPEDSGQCEFCVGMNLTAPLEVVMEPWDFKWFPCAALPARTYSMRPSFYTPFRAGRSFDFQTVTFTVAVTNSDIFTCDDFFTDPKNATGLFRAPAGAPVSASTTMFLPPTGEWALDSVETTRGATAAECHVTIKLTRVSHMFVLKQVLISILVVVSGLSAPFLHVADHTGDRCALMCPVMELEPFSHPRQAEHRTIELLLTHSFGRRIGTAWRPCSSSRSRFRRRSASAQSIT